MTLNEVLNAYEYDLRIRAKVSSRRIAAVHCRTILRDYGPNFPADQISRATVNDLIETLREAGQRDTSINGVLRVLRAALRLAGLESPVKLLRETKKIPNILEVSDIRRLMECAPGPDEKLAIAFAAYAGLRHQEIAHLFWNDIEGGVVRVRAKGAWTPKSHAEREVPICSALQVAISEHRRMVDADHFPLFNASYFTAGIREAFKVAGLYINGTKPGLHMLRRTFASRLLGCGTDIETVRELGGWASLDTVQRYLSSTSALKRAAVEKL